MEPFAWDEEKNRLLKRLRGVSFEEVIFHLEDGDLIKRVDHPNQQRYVHQQIFVVQIDDYVYLVPFVEDHEKYFLKTIIPSRKLTRAYLKKKEKGL